MLATHFWADRLLISGMARIILTAENANHKTIFISTALDYGQRTAAPRDWRLESNCYLQGTSLGDWTVKDILSNVVTGKITQRSNQLKRSLHITGGI